MDTIFRGDLSTRRGRALAWIDSLFIDHALVRLAWTNFAEVVPGRLAAIVRRHRIRTLINLRGRTASGSDALSREAATRLGLDFIDAPLKSSAPPPRERILHLLDIFATMREPALIHCKSGADRAGLAAAIYLLAHGATVAQAARQLSLRHGHIAGAEAGILGAFLQSYGREGEGRLPFRDWVATAYDPAALANAHNGHAALRFLARSVLRRE